MLNSHLYLPDPEQGEKIEFILRRHSLIMAASSLIYIVLLIVPWIFRWFVKMQFPFIWETPALYTVMFLAGSVYLLFIVLFFFSNYIDYWLDVWIITNERIISIEQRGLFARSFSEEKLYRIQDVRAEVNGFFPTIMHYGNVTIQTSAVENATMKQVPSADIVAKRIMVLMEEAKRRHPGEN